MTTARASSQNPEVDSSLRDHMERVSDSSWINKIFHGDCIEGMKMIPSNSIDLILTDPPFGLKMKHGNTSNYNRKASRVLQGYNEVQPRDYQDFSHKWISEASRILKNAGNMFIFSGYNHLKEILIALDDNHLQYVNQLIWNYPFGVYTKRRFVAAHYNCLYYCKNDKMRRFYRDARFPDTKEQYHDMQSVWTIKREYWTGEIKTPNKLPAEIIRKIIQYTTNCQNDIVFDPFLGSGQVAVVAKQMNRRYSGFEIVKEYYDFAQGRLK